jgi:hypothetical protein
MNLPYRTTETEGDDYHVTNHGTIVTITPLTQDAADWIDENVATEDWQWMGGALAIEPRYAGELLYGMQEDGLTSNVRVECNA